MLSILNSATATFTATALLASATIITGLSVKTLDQATAKQCLMQSWPAESHDTNIKWCVDNGYQVN